MQLMIFKYYIEMPVYHTSVPSPKVNIFQKFYRKMSLL